MVNTLSSTASSSSTSSSSSTGSGPTSAVPLSSSSSTPPSFVDSTSSENKNPAIKNPKDDKEAKVIIKKIEQLERQLLTESGQNLAQTYNQLAIQNYNIGEHDTAFSCLESALSFVKKDTYLYIVLLLRKANWLRRTPTLDNLQKAFEFYNKALTLAEASEFDNYNILYGKARTLNISGDYKSALNIYLELLNRSGEGGTDLFRRIGDCYKKLNQLTDALNAYRKAAKLRPDDIKLKQTIEQLEWNIIQADKCKPGNSPPIPVGTTPKIDLSILEGDRYIVQGNIEQALQSYQKRLNEIKKSKAKESKEVKTTSDIDDDAAEKFNLLLSLLHEKISFAFHMRGENQESLLHLQKAIELQKVKKLFTLVNLGELYEGLDRHVEALNTYTEAAVLQSRCPTNDHLATYRKARVLMEIGRFPEAIEEYKKSLTPKARYFFEAHHDLGILYYNIENFEESIRLLEAANKLDRTHLDTQLWLDSAKTALHAQQEQKKAAAEQRRICNKARKERHKTRAAAQQAAATEAKKVVKVKTIPPKKKEPAPFVRLHHAAKKSTSELDAVLQEFDEKKIDISLLHDGTGGNIYSSGYFSLENARRLRSRVGPKTHRGINPIHEAILRSDFSYLLVLLDDEENKIHTESKNPCSQTEEKEEVDEIDEINLPRKMMANINVLVGIRCKTNLLPSSTPLFLAVQKLAVLKKVDRVNKEGLKIVQYLIQKKASTEVPPGVSPLLMFVIENLVSYLNSLTVTTTPAITNEVKRSGGRTLSVEEKNSIICDTALINTDHLIMQYIELITALVSNDKTRKMLATENTAHRTIFRVCLKIKNDKIREKVIQLLEDAGNTEAQQIIFNYKSRQKSHKNKDDDLLIDPSFVKYLETMHQKEAKQKDIEEKERVAALKADSPLEAQKALLRKNPYHLVFTEVVEVLAKTNPEEALIYCQAALAKKPARTDIRTIQGILHLQLNQFELAVKNFDEGISFGKYQDLEDQQRRRDFPYLIVDMYYLTLLTHKGYALLRWGRYSEATVILKKSITSLDPALNADRFTANFHYYAMSQMELRISELYHESIETKTYFNEVEQCFAILENKDEDYYERFNADTTTPAETKSTETKSSEVKPAETKHQIELHDCWKLNADNNTKVAERFFMRGCLLSSLNKFEEANILFEKAFTLKSDKSFEPFYYLQSAEVAYKNNKYKVAVERIKIGLGNKSHLFSTYVRINKHGYDDLHEKLGDYVYNNATTHLCNETKKKEYLEAVENYQKALEFFLQRKHRSSNKTIIHARMLLKQVQALFEIYKIDQLSSAVKAESKIGMTIPKDNPKDLAKEKILSLMEESCSLNPSGPFYIRYGEIYQYFKQFEEAQLCFEAARGYIRHVAYTNKKDVNQVKELDELDDKISENEASKSKFEKESKRDDVLFSASTSAYESVSLSFVSTHPQGSLETSSRLSISINQLINNGSQPIFTPLSDIENKSGPLVPPPIETTVTSSIPATPKLITQ